MKKTIIPIACFMLAGCAIAQTLDAKKAMDESLAAYRTCLEANRTDISACEVEKITHEANIRAYEAAQSNIGKY